MFSEAKHMLSTKHFVLATVITLIPISCNRTESMSCLLLRGAILELCESSVDAADCQKKTDKLLKVAKSEDDRLCFDGLNEFNNMKATIQRKQSTPDSAQRW